MSTETCVRVLPHFTWYSHIHQATPISTPSSSIMVLPPVQSTLLPCWSIPASGMYKEFTSLIAQRFFAGHRAHHCSCAPVRPPAAPAARAIQPRPAIITPWVIVPSVHSYTCIACLATCGCFQVQSKVHQSCIASCCVQTGRNPLAR